MKNVFRGICIGFVLLGLLTGMVFAAGEKEAPKEFEVLYFVGGMGEMANHAVAKLRENNPEVDIKLEYNHKAHDVVRNKMMAGSPPDVFMINKGLYSHYGAIEEGLLGSVEFILDAPTLDGTGTLRDRINEGSLSIGYVDGKNYLIPEVSFLGGMWYDANLMDDLGVKIPETWDEFMDACEVLKQNGITPFGYLGDFAHEYPLNYFFFPLLRSVDNQTFIDIQNLVPGSWDTPAVRETLERIVEMRDKGYIWEPSVSAHIEIQMEFIRRNIGFYPCGSWLKAEMADSWPDDFELQFFAVPGKSEPNGQNYVYTSDLVSAVPSEPRNKEMTIEYYQYQLSDEETIAKTIEEFQFVMPLTNFSEDFGHLLPEAVISAVRAAEETSTFESLWGLWYPKLPNEAGNNINSLVSGDQSIDDFIRRMEEAQKSVREDDTIPKYEYH